MQLIINADDIGSSLDVNNAAVDLMSKGLVTSASLIPNAPYAEEACALAARFPGCSFGVHLNVTHYSPLSDPEGVEGLLSSDKVFDGKRIRRISIDSRLADGIFNEFCAQIEKLVSLGVKVSHIDSHMQVHTIPRIFPVLKKVQKRFDIRKVRLSRNIYGSHEKVLKGLRAKKAIYNFFLKYYYRTTTTQGFTDFKTFCEYGTSRKAKYRVVEVMVHPGAHNSEEETTLLNGPWREALEFPVHLISYNDLG